MKKILFTAIALCAAMTMNAENSLTIKPLVVTPGTEAVAEIVLVNDCEACDIAFKCYLPAGFTYKGGGRTGTTYADGTTTVFTSRADLAFKNGESGYGQWAGSINNKNGEYYLKVGGVGGGEYDYLDGNDGTLMELHFNVPADATPGVYPVIFKDVCINSWGKEEVYNEVFVSYLVVGTPEPQALVLGEGIVPSFVNTALAADTYVNKVDLSHVTALNGDFTYVDSRNVVAPADVTASVKYEGDKTGYYSVNVPFGADVTGKVYKLTSTTDKFAHFDPVTSVEAGKTYLAEGKVTLAANAKVAGVAEQTGQTGNYVLNDTFYHGSNLTVPATRGLFEGASLSNLRVVVDGVLTNINVAQIEAGEASYDLQGRQVQNTKNGVFVVNGKKQFVK